MSLKHELSLAARIYQRTIVSIHQSVVKFQVNSDPPLSFMEENQRRSMLRDHDDKIITNAKTLNISQKIDSNSVFK